jgi:hypothetical protein
MDTARVIGGEKEKKNRKKGTIRGRNKERK